ncbi:uncharacterized protein EI90DRAFT_3149425 [Cantharellus anzutake]|uniref:uncharacterized protein n=1 Tax=Cantharellus anzutake TaxID=1750568 RepID=UPI001904FDA2|nr:uncharacterized protein EI90DRAFT_3149425 [Cantharellus anzutake]KAF8343933.1 hypothetical protein EI90DRAFT_3149425 [Cantharellus anzutake]
MSDVTHPETGALLSTDAEDEGRINDPGLISELFGAHPTALSKSLLGFCLFLILLLSVFIGLYAGVQSRLSRVLRSAPTITETFKFTTSELRTVVRTVTSTRTITLPPPTPSPTVETCIARDCVVLAADVVKGFNNSNDPCEDFYEYANGGWDISTTIPPGRSSHSRFDEVAEANIRTIEGILRRPLSSTASVLEARALAKLQDFYSSCLNLNALGAVGSEPLRLVVRRIRELLPDLLTYQRRDSSPLDLTDAMAFLHSINIEVFFSTVFEGQLKGNPDEIALWLKNPSPLLPRRGLDEEGVSNYRAALFDFFYDLDEESPDEAYAWPPWPWPPHKPTPENRTSKARRLSEATVLFESQLIKYMTVPDEPVTSNISYVQLPIENLTSTMAYLDLPGFVATFLPTNFPKTIIVQDLVYLQGLNELIAATSAEVIRAYLIAQVSLALSEYLDLNTRPYKILKTLREKVHGVVPDSTLAREAFCINEATGNLGYLISYFFVKETFDDTVRRKVASLVDALFNTFIESFMNSTWMDESTATFAMLKMRAMKVKLSYPDVRPNVSDIRSTLQYYSSVDIVPEAFFTNLIQARWSPRGTRLWEETESLCAWVIRVNRQIKKWATLGDNRDVNTWSLNPITVSISYRLHSNSVEIPAGSLFLPFFSRYVPDYMVYSALGALVAHELAHAIDTLGSNYGSRGQLQQWWTNLTRSNYDSKRDCILGLHPDSQCYRDGQIDFDPKSRETFADTAIILALRAWKSQSTLDNLLPGLRDFSVDQLFFISFARIWSSSSIASRPSNYVSIKDRVHNALKNIPEFAATFNCSAGATLNPLSRCLVW